MSIIISCYIGRMKMHVSGLEKVYFFGLWHVSCLLNITILTEG